MGMGVSHIRFKDRIPSLPEIQADFHVQTGLELHLVVNLNILEVTTDLAEIQKLLQRNVEAVEQLRAEQQRFQQAHPGNYEAWAKFRDDVFTKEIKLLNHLSDARFEIVDFYELDFFVENDVLVLESYANQDYGIDSLIKVLLDLGGQEFFLGENYPVKWEKSRRLVNERRSKLKQWHEYKFYNRPRK